MKFIDDLIKTLTPAEREKHKDLIQECLRREEDLNQVDPVLHENIEKLVDAIDNIFNAIDDCNDLSNRVRLMVEKGKGRSELR